MLIPQKNIFMIISLLVKHEKELQVDYPSNNMKEK